MSGKRNLAILDASTGSINVFPGAFALNNGFALAIGWSHNGRSLAWIDDGSNSIKVLTLPGGTIKMLRRFSLSQPALEGPAWSPDGKQLAFTADSGNPTSSGPVFTRVDVIDTASGRIERTVRVEGDISALRWTTAGLDLYGNFASLGPSGGTGVTRIGGRPQLVAKMTLAIRAVSPNGRYAAATQAPGFDQMYLVNLAAKQARPLDSGTHAEYALGWSGNSQDVAFLRSTSTKTVNGPLDLYVAPPSGSPEQLIASNVRATGWSPWRP